MTEILGVFGFLPIATDYALFYELKNSVTHGVTAKRQKTSSWFEGDPQPWVIM
jgi:hypothetical protein